jgi:hypothetical protein
MSLFGENKIATDFGSYRHYVRGPLKSGKSTLFRDLVLEQYGDQKFGLLISMGNETGYKALAKLNVGEAKTWDGFVKIVDELVNHKDKYQIKIVAFDTVDELVAIAIAETFKVHKKKFPTKPARTINDVLGGYGAGKKWVIKAINDQMARLEGKGYGLFFIGHTKLRDIKETPDSDAYQTLTSNLETDYNGIFADKADLIATIFLRRKADENGVLASSERKIYFRSEGFIDSGARFPGIPENVPMSARDYIDAFEVGVQSADPELSAGDIEQRRKEEVENRDTAAKNFVDAGEEPESLEDVQSNIVLIAKQLGGSKDPKVAEICTKYNTFNPYVSSDMKKLTAMLEDLKQLEKETEKVI